jgi:hypothetical protein
VNVKLLRKIQKHILEEPKRFIMSDIIVRDRPGAEFDDYGISFQIPDCGTTACICGWALILGGKPRSRHEFSDAQKLLGIEDTSALF